MGAALLTGCQVRPPANDPNLDWFYAVGPSAQNNSLDQVALNSVVVHARDAFLGPVIREVARQADICLIYPAEWDALAVSLDLVGPADQVLDLVARRYELRFQWQGKVGYIGKPLADDRIVAAFRAPFDDCERIISPLLAEGGKVSQSGAWVFIADRAQTVQRVLNAVLQVDITVYCVQVLELYQDDSVNLDLSTDGVLRIPKDFVSPLFDRQIKLAAETSGVFVGRSWTTLISEGKDAKNFYGVREAIKDSTVTTASASPIISEKTVQTSSGWKINIKISRDRLEGEIINDAPGEVQYSIPVSCPRPGLYLVHVGRIISDDRKLGLLASHYITGNSSRFVWLRYLPLGRPEFTPFGRGNSIEPKKIEPLPVVSIQRLDLVKNESFKTPAFFKRFGFK